MIKQNFIIVCEQVIIGQNNNISLINTFENIYSSKEPVIHPRFSVVSKFEKGEDENNEQELKILIKDESMNEIAKLPGKIAFGENKKGQHIGNFINIAFPRFGVYKIEIYISERLQPLFTTIKIEPIKK